MKYLIFSIAIVLFFACKQTKDSTAENTTNPNTSQTETIYRFKVSFISIGTGTDIKAKKQFDQFIAKYEQKNRVKLDYETTRWGREGEIDYCFGLTALNKKKQERFIIKTKEVLENSSLIRYSENSTCR